MAKPSSILQSTDVPFLEQVAGAGRGRVHELGRARISIGRAQNADLMIPHESVSREHAHIEQSEDGSYVIFDNGSKNGVIINGQKMDAAPLHDGDVIQLGIFAFRFVCPQVQLENEPQALAELGEHVPAYGESTVKAPNSKRPLLYGGLVAVLGLVYWFSNTETPQSKTNEGETAVVGGEQDRMKISEAPRFDQAASQNSVAGLDDPTLKAAEQELSRLDFNDSTVRESEAYFRRGQREYFNKNYHRAIDAFQTSLAMYRKHPLARYYLQSAYHEAEIAAKKNMEMGVKYFESLQYSRAIYHFQQVVTLMAHRPNERIVSDCQKYIELSKRRLQAAELFP